MPPERRRWHLHWFVEVRALGPTAGNRYGYRRRVLVRCRCGEYRERTVAKRW